MPRLESGDRRLATALLELAKEDNQVEEYLSALKSVNEDLSKEPKLLDLLSSHQVNLDDLYALLEKLYSNKGLKHLVPFLKLLVKKRYMIRFNDVYEQYVLLADEYLGIEEGIVYSVKLLSEKELTGLETLFGTKLGKKVHFINRTEPSLLGGIRVFISGKAYDGSLSKKLESLKETLLEASKGGNSL